MNDDKNKKGRNSIKDRGLILQEKLIEDAKADKTDIPISMTGYESFRSQFSPRVVQEPIDLSTFEPIKTDNNFQVKMM